MKIPNVNALCALGLASLMFCAGARAEPPSFETPVAPAEPQLLPADTAQILDAVRAAKAKVVVVNVWATWCVPCRKEFPDLMRLYRTYKDRGVALVLVSGDFSSQKDEAAKFLASQGVDFPSFLKAGKDQDFIDGFDPQWSGALPATFLYDAKGARIHSFLGPVTFESLELEVAPLVGATSKPDGER